MSKPRRERVFFVGSLEAEMERMSLVEIKPTPRPRIPELPAEVRCLIMSHTTLVVDTLDYEGIPIDLPFARPLRRHGKFCECKRLPRYQDRSDPEECKCIEVEGVTLVKRREEKPPCSFCKNRAISENGLFKATKETREEALRIFYSKNQFMLLDGYSVGRMERMNLERRVAFIPPAHLKRVNRVIIDLYVLMLVYKDDPVYTYLPNRWKELLDETLSFVKETFRNENLHVKLLYAWNKHHDPSEKQKWLVRKTIERAAEFGFGSLSATIQMSILYKPLPNGHCTRRVLQDDFYTFSGPDVGKKLDKAVRTWKAVDWY